MGFDAVFAASARDHSDLPLGGWHIQHWSQDVTLHYEWYRALQLARNLAFSDALLALAVNINMTRS